MTDARLWIDQPGAAERASEEPEPWLRDALTQFIAKGFTILPGAVPEAAIDCYQADLAAVAPTASGLILGSPHGDMPLEQGDLSVPLSRVLDAYVEIPSALALMFAPRLRTFLSRVFADDVLAFQSLHFEVGSTQAVHQDTAYIAVQEPSRFAASWIALEDIQPGSGELIYYPGSHRWRGPWEEETYGWAEAHNRYLLWLNEEAERRGTPAQSFQPKKGDVLLWHADLAHGGGPITRDGVTRRSYVTHYSGLADTPRYFRRPDRAVKLPVGPGAAVASRHYALPGQLKGWTDPAS